MAGRRKTLSAKSLTSCVSARVYALVTWWVSKRSRLAFSGIKSPGRECRYSSLLRPDGKLKLTKIMTGVVNSKPQATVLGAKGGVTVMDRWSLRRRNYHRWGERCRSPGAADLDNGGGARTSLRVA
jgi:hypothetical protein